MIEIKTDFKFFLPSADNKDMEEQLYDSIIKFNTLSFKNIDKNKKIYSIRYIHNGKLGYDVVGKAEERTGEIIIAILDAGDLFLTCTPNRGVIRDIPLMQGKHSTHEVVYFADSK